MIELVYNGSSSFHDQQEGHATLILGINDGCDGLLDELVDDHGNTQRDSTKVIL